MISAILLLVCSVRSSVSDYQYQVQAFSRAYISYGFPEKVDLERRKKGLNEMLHAMQKVYQASADFSGGGYSRRYIGYALTKAIEWGFVAPLVSFGDQFEDFSGIQQTVASDLLRLLLGPGIAFPYCSEDKYGCMLSLSEIRERRVSIFEKALRFISEVVCYVGTHGEVPGNDVHHGNKYWYRELLHRVIEKKRIVLQHLSRPLARR